MSGRKRVGNQSRPSRRSRTNKYLDDFDAPHIQQERPRQKGLSRNNIQYADMGRCYDILKELMSTPQAKAWFNAPLDYVGLGFPLYPTVISSGTPMDLGSIETMLLMNSLEHPDHFADHVRIVCQNATEFNQIGSECHIAAVQLKEIFEEKYQAFLKEFYSPEAMEQQQSEQGAVQAAMTEEEIKDFMARIQHLMSVKKEVSITQREINLLKKDRSKSSKLKHVNISKPVKMKTFTYEEKEALVRAMTELDEEAIRGLLLIIHPDGQASGEIEIDFLQFDDETLLRLKSYVDTYTKPKKERPPPPVVQPPTKKRRIEKEVESAQSRREKLAAAREITEKRLQRTRKQINGVEKLKHLKVGQNVVVNPAEPGDEEFWLGQVVQIPSDAKIQIQWYELKNRDSISLLKAGTGGDVREYAKTTSYDVIDTDSVIFNAKVPLSYDEQKQLWVLNNVSGLLSQITDY